MSILSQQKQSQNTDFPNIRPSLDLRFALAKKLDPRITFTRGSTGTYFGADGLMRTAGVNEPRFDHDPITGQSLGLLIEESRQNLLTYSEQFDNAAWTKLGSSVSTNVSITTAPDNSNNADKLIEDTTNGEHRFLSSSISWVGNTRYTFSLFVKGGERTRFDLLLGTGSNWVSGRQVAFDLVSGTIISTDGATGTITRYPNGWYRCSVTGLTIASPVASLVALRIINTGTNAAYQGDGTSGIYIWGAQIEAGAFPTSYIPTTASTVTRSADNASMTGTNFSSWYNQTEGTIYSNISITRSLTTSSTGSWTLDNGSFANGYTLSHTSTVSTRLSVRGPNTRGTGESIGDVTNVDVTRLKNCSIILPSTTNTILSCSNAKFSAIEESFSSGVTVNRLLIGLNNIIGTAANNYLNGTISRLTYYPIRITNQQLINLTS